MRAIVTVISEQYAAQYRVLRESIRAYCPTLQIIVGVYGTEEFVDKLRAEESLGFQTVIDVQKRPGMKRALYPDSYDDGTYIAAIRYKLIQQLFEEAFASEVLLLGSDMRFYAPAVDCFDVPNRYSMAVTPHVLTKLPDDGKFPSMRMLQLTGHLNGDYVFFRNTARVRNFIKFVAEELETKCLGEHNHGIFFDQTYLSLCYIFLPNIVYTVPDLGINMAYYNLHERVLDEDGMINSGIASLKLFHFTGFNRRDPSRLSRYIQRREQLTLPIVKLALEYAKAVDDKDF